MRSVSFEIRVSSFGYASESIIPSTRYPSYRAPVPCSTNLSRNEALQHLFSHKVNADASRNPIIRVTWPLRLAQGRRPFGMGRFGRRR